MIFIYICAFKKKVADSQFLMKLLMEGKQAGGPGNPHGTPGVSSWHQLFEPLEVYTGSDLFNYLPEAPA